MTDAGSQQGRQGAPWWRVAVVALLCGVGGRLLNGWALDCDELECITTGLLATAAGVVLLPLLAVAGLALAHVPRPVRVALAGSLAALAVVLTGSSFETAVRGGGADGVPSLLTVLLGAVLGGWTGLVVASPAFRTSQRWAAALVVVLVFALSLA